MVNFGPPAAEIGSAVLDIPANFSGFRVLALLMQRHRSAEANQTLHDVLAVSWSGTLYLHFRELLARNGILPDAQFILRQSCAVLYWQRYCTALE